MFLPLAGLMLFGIPTAGFVLGIVLYCYRPLRQLRPLAIFAVLVPVLASYAGCAGFWSAAIGMDRLGFRDRATLPIGLLGFVIGACLGIWIAVKSGRLIGRRFSN